MTASLSGQMAVGVNNRRCFTMNGKEKKKMCKVGKLNPEVVENEELVLAMPKLV